MPPRKRHWRRPLGPAIVLAVAGLATVAGGAAAQEAPARTPAEAKAMAVAAAAAAFLAELRTPEQRELTRAAFDDVERRTWAFGPVERLGIPVGDLRAADQERLDALLDTVLSDKGMAAFREIQVLESVLRRRESRPDRVATYRDPNLYWLRIYGPVKPDAAWGWRFEGHHFALHVTNVPGALPTVTPFFLGASPLLGVKPTEWPKGWLEESNVETGPERPTVEIFAELNTRLGALVTALEVVPEATGKPRDVRMGPGSDALPKALGDDASAFEDEAKQALSQLVTTFDDLLDPPFRRYADDAKSSATTKFAVWSSDEIDQERGWCVQTDRFSLELVTTTGPEHVHVVLRDVDYDFGGPLKSPEGK